MAGLPRWSFLCRLAVALVVALGCTTVALADYCTSAYVWLQDGSRKQQADWSSYGADTGFGKGPCLGVAGIGYQITPVNTLIVVDRNGASNGYINVQGTNKPAYGEEVNLNNNANRGLDVLTNTFCSTGQSTPDGRFLSMGGDYTYGTGQQYLGGGIGSVRSFTPCTNGQCTFSIVGGLQKGRWYPSSQLLGDGRIMVVGGSQGGTGLNNNNIHVPYIEYVPNNGKGPYYSQFLVNTLPYNLYPFLHLLPSGEVFVFAGNQWMLYNTGSNQPVGGNRPSLNSWGPNGKQIFWSYPLSGTSALMPLRKANGYNPEILICGGATTASAYNGGQDANAPASNKCFRIFPKSGNPQWIETPAMSAPRVMPMAVLLPDGKVFIHGGAKNGWAGLGTSCHNAVLKPDMWDAYGSKWYYGKGFASSKVPRVYHAGAMLTQSGAVLIVGSNPKESIQVNQYDFPTEFRGEYFYPDYMPNAGPRPVITGGPGSFQVGTNFQVKFNFKSASSINVVLSHPGFSTHASNQGMRNIVLDVKGVQNTGGQSWVVTVAAPPNKNVAPPTWYFLWVLEKGIPNTQAKIVYVK